MIEKVLKRKNLYRAYRKVVRNKGSAGVEDMKVTVCFPIWKAIGTVMLCYLYLDPYICAETYRRGDEARASGQKVGSYPKENGKIRLLGIPTVVDRWLQQAVSQVLMTKYELTFEEYSYGFRPQKNIHKAVTQALKYRT